FADAPVDESAGRLYSADLIRGLCFVAVPRDHRLARKTTLTLGDLSGEALGTLPANHAHRQDLATRFEQKGLEFCPKVESQTFLAILQFVAAGQCCSVLDPLTAVHIDKSKALAEEVIILPLKEPIYYQYALYAPRYRPMSLLADKLRHAWVKKAMDLMSARGAEPELHVSDISLHSTS
ncbi:MAG: LysR substrate-binding domain-containing protein, partial [Pseudomonadota bacterium]